MHTVQNMVIVQKMIQTIKNFAKVFFIIDFGVIAFCIIMGNTTWLINTQVAFVSSLIISLATFFSYQNSVSKRLANSEGNIDTLDDRDKIDEIDDPYDLYSEDGVQEEKELTATEIKTIIQEEKSKVKRNSLKNTFRNGGTFVSLYRLVGYSILVLGFMYLVNHKLFEPFSYMIGLFIVPLSMLVIKLTSKSEL